MKMKNSELLVEKRIEEVAEFLRGLNGGRLPRGITTNTIRYYVANIHEPLATEKRAKLAGYKDFDEEQLEEIDGRIREAAERVDCIIGRLIVKGGWSV